MTAIFEWLGAVVAGLDFYKIHILFGIAAPTAAVATAYVMRRIDDGQVRGIGPWLGLLVPLFAMTIGATRALLERTSWAESGPYAVALLVLVGAACIWLVLPISTLRNQMWGPPSGGPGPAEAGPHVNSATRCYFVSSHTICTLFLRRASAGAA